MKTHLIVAFAIAALSSEAHAQMQSNAPADRAATQTVSQALVKAGVDPRTTSVRVITTADHTIYLSGLISSSQTIKSAVSAAQEAAPSYHVVNNIRSSFFGDPNHVTGDKTK